MDNRNYTVRFENGNEITVRYEPYASPPLRRRRSSALVLDEFAGIEDFSEPLIETFNSYQPGYIMNSEEFFNAWQSMNEYEFSIVDGRIQMVRKEAPDLGEFSPSQELNDFVNALIQCE